VRTGSEVMFFADRMKVPPDLGTVKPKSQQQKFDV
jgi:hypothetical protein